MIEPEEGTRCGWSGKPEPGVRAVELPGPRGAQPVVYRVCPQHEARLRAFNDRCQRNRDLAMGAFIVSLLSFVLPAFSDAAAALAVPCALLGVTLIAFPYATPMTVARNGIARSVLLLRVTGAALLTFALALTVASLL